MLPGAPPPRKAPHHRRVLPHCKKVVAAVVVAEGCAAEACVNTDRRDAPIVGYAEHREMVGS